MWKISLLDHICEMRGLLDVIIEFTETSGPVFVNPQTHITSRTYFRYSIIQMKLFGYKVNLVDFNYDAYNLGLIIWAMEAIRYNAAELCNRKIREYMRGNSPLKDY